MPLHYEELWNDCEQFHQQHSPPATAEALVEAVLLKLNLYKAIDYEKMAAEDAQQAKTRVLGEILMTLTQLSLTDNVNVFDALQIALHYHNVEMLSHKHQ